MADHTQVLDQVLDEREGDATVDGHAQALERALRQNAIAVAILERAARLRLRNWYLGAGAVTGTVWNVLHGMEPWHGIKDYDLVYFDARDVTAAGEAAVEDNARDLLADLGVDVDLTNQARVHLWYAERFGRPIAPFRSTEQAIGTWVTTASSVGVRYDEDAFTVCAPFGLGDLFAMVVRPNKAMVGEDVYRAKTTRWKETWPGLCILPW